MTNKKDNYKYIVGFIIGIILFGGTTYATIKYAASQVVYDNNNSTLVGTDVQTAITELANKYSQVSSCPSDKVCVQKKTTLAVGDYVSYTPSKTYYLTDTSMTGYTSSQAINPSELNLWRVISLNQDGTVDIVSEYVSSVGINLKGKTGFLNAVGYLNVLASQYETDGITVGSRYFGYNGQTEYIAEEDFIDTPYACTTNGVGGNCNPDPDDYESAGGGDTLYTTDLNLVKTILGTTIATKPSGAISNYWVASRHFRSHGSLPYWHVSSRDRTGSSQSYGLYTYKVADGTFVESYADISSLRPIVRLSSTLSYSGVGNKTFPMEIQ